jgi:hypothetical protein
LRFDNEFYVNLVKRKWRLRKWNGPEQFEDEETGTLMMLPTDLALVKDANFRPIVEEYAKDERLFFREFASAFGKLLALGCPAHVQPNRVQPPQSEKDKASAEFREQAMHGSLLAAKKIAPKADVHQVEATSGRTALHKAAFWGHTDMVGYLVKEAKVGVNVQDNYGDTALHDASKFGHEGVVKHLLEGGANVTIKNKQGQDAIALATQHDKKEIVALLKAAASRPQSKI